MENAVTGNLVYTPPKELTPTEEKQARVKDAENKSEIRKNLAGDIAKGERDIQEETLLTDRNWIDASRITYSIENDGEPFQGDDEEAAKMGLELMSHINYNLGAGTIPFAMKASDGMDDTQKIAVRYMMDTYDNKDISFDGSMRFLKEMAIDPANLPIVGTLAAGAMGKGAAQIAARKGLMESIKLNTKAFATSTYGQAAMEGALYGAADNAAFQNIRMGTGEQDKFNTAEMLATAGIGAVIAPVAVKGLSVGGNMIAKGGKSMKQALSDYTRDLENQMAQLAGGGDIPGMTPYPKDKLTPRAQEMADEAGMLPEDLDQEILEILNHGAAILDSLDEQIRKDADGFGEDDIVQYKRPDGILEANKKLLEAKAKKPTGKEIYHPISKKTYILSDDGTVYFHRKLNDTWKKSININQKKEIKELSEKGEKAFLEARKETPEKIDTLEKLPNEYKNINLSKSQQDFFKRAIPKKEELKKETQRYISKKSPAPKKIYRGEVLEGEERIGGGAKEGYGLYTTVDKKLASQYGTVAEMNPLTDLPKKPLVFTGMNEFEIWEQTLDYKVLKYKRASEKGDIALNEVVNLIDDTIDGIQIGSGISANSGTYWVKFPSIEEFRNFEK